MKINKFKIKNQKNVELINQFIRECKAFENSLIILNKLYRKNYNKYILDYRYLLNLLKNRVDFNNEILLNINEISELKELLEQTKEQSKNLGSETVFYSIIKDLVDRYKSYLKTKDITKHPQIIKPKDLMNYKIELNKKSLIYENNQYYVILKNKNSRISIAKKIDFDIQKVDKIYIEYIKQKKSLNEALMGGVAVIIVKGIFVM